MVLLPASVRVCVRWVVYNFILFQKILIEIKTNFAAVLQVEETKQTRQQDRTPQHHTAAQHHGAQHRGAGHKGKARKHSNTAQGRGDRERTA